MNEDIKESIHRIREVLYKMNSSDYRTCSQISFTSSSFPSACCDDTSELLGLYLKKYHNLNSEHIRGLGLGNNTNTSHVWLVCDNFIIDITADQFNDRGYELPSVIIEKKSTFHESFHTIKSEPLQFKVAAIPRILEIVMSLM